MGSFSQPGSDIVIEQRAAIPAIALGSFERVLVIGLGGIGTALVGPLCRFLVYSSVGSALPVILADGDEFERRNRERQDFFSTGNKARVKAAEMRRTFPELSIRSIPEFITPDNISSYIGERSLVLLGVDNHASRRLLSRYCAGLRSSVLISGGNEMVDGNVQVQVRWDGVEHTPPLTRFHPEIDEAVDFSSVLSCDEGARSGEPQLLFANLLAAAHMLNTFYALINGGLTYEELYFDIILGRSEPISRNV